jgi:hypothetical protein
MLAQRLERLLPGPHELEPHLAGRDLLAETLFEQSPCVGHSSDQAPPLATLPKEHLLAFAAYYRRRTSRRTSPGPPRASSTWCPHCRS